MKRRQNNFIKGEAAAESSVWKMLLPSVLGIIVCTICLAGMTWAWFTSGVQSQSTISAKEYSLNETITVQNAKSGAPEKSSDGNYTLAENTTYVVKLKPSVTPKSGGYCMLKITPADGSEAVYYTQPLKATHEVSFTISNGDGAATCQLIAAWGAPDVSKTVNKKLIISGDTIEINGGTSAVSTEQPVQDQGNSDSAKPSVNSNGGKDSTDSNASTNGDQKDTGDSTTTQKNDQETTGE